MLYFGGPPCAMLVELVLNVYMIVVLGWNEVLLYLTGEEVDRGIGVE